jgi:3-oxoacyl-[acyl-carrier-protein] synthase-1
MNSAPGSRFTCSLEALGMVNALGRSPDEIWPRALAGDQSHFQIRDDLVPGRSLVVGAVSGELPKVPDSLRRFACRNNSMTLAALESIEDSVADVVAAVGRERVAVVMGSSTSGVGDAELAIAHQIATGSLAPSFDYVQLELGGVAGFVATLLDLRGPSFTISTACSSGARALASARSLLALGLADAVIAGATDTLCGLTTNGFTALQVIAEGVSNPCSVNRSGLTLGEGSAVFLVTSGDGGIRLRGVGESSEAHHMSSPDPDGAGAVAAMRGALDDAALSADAIAYLNLHGTGTRLNDAMECTAVATTFPKQPPCSSSKPLIGHGLGAAGALEAGLCWLTLHEQAEGEIALIPHAYDGAWDPELSPIPLTTKGMRVPVGPVMSNSFGFGGSNCCLILDGKGA